MTKALKTIPIASDHAGYEIKQFLVEKLHESGFDVKDYGTYSEESVNYPDYIHEVAAAIQHGDYQTGIILCGSGNGARITANKYRGVRAALAWKKELAVLGRQHNDANILSLPGRYVTHEEAWEIVMAFLETPFEGGRHLRRVEKISRLKNNN